jgi:hypothetical protein
VDPVVGAQRDRAVGGDLCPVDRGEHVALGEHAALVQHRNFFGDAALFNRAGWQHILDKHHGRLPIRVKAVPEVTVGNRTIGGDFSVDQPWWDTLSKFSSDFYFLSLDARVEAWKGRWGGFVDGYWIFGKSTVGGSDSRLVLRDRVDVTLSSNVTTHFDTGQVNFGPQFKLGTAPLSAT